MFQTFVLVSTEMKKLYYRYGKCMYMNVKFNICGQKPNTKRDQEIQQLNRNIRNKSQKFADREYCLVTFFGFNSLRNLVIFGFATVLDESFETISKVLKKFFEFQGSIQTHTIVTDRREGIEMAISQLNQQYNNCFQHLFDPIQLIRRIDLNKKQSIVGLKAVIQAQTNHQYNQSLKMLKRTLSAQDREKVRQLQQNKRFICFSKIPKTFTQIRLSYAISPSEEFQQLIRSSKIKLCSSTYDSLVNQLFAMFQEVANTSNNLKIFPKKNYQKQILQQLKNCRKNLPCVILQQLEVQVTRSLHHKYEEQTSIPGSYSVYSVNEDKSIWNKASVTIDKHLNFKCTCGYKQKTQLPCDHMIGIAFRNKIDVFSLIGDFYRREAGQFDEKLKSGQKDAEKQRQSYQQSQG